MRQLVRTYTITGQHEITITGASFTKEDVRLIINETLAITDKKASILVSSTAKNNIVSVVSGVITLASTTAALTVGDELTIEIDIDNIAKESNATTNKWAILDALAAAKLAIQGDDATATLLALKTAIANLPTVAQIQNGLAKTTDIPNDYALEATAQDILDDIGDLTDIIEAINGDDIGGIINSYMDDYAEQLQAILGVENDSDSSSES